MVKEISNLALIDRTTVAFIDSRKKELVQSAFAFTFLEATAKTAIAALSSWKVNVLSLS